jgi:hypothetical protein
VPERNETMDKSILEKITSKPTFDNTKEFAEYWKSELTSCNKHIQKFNDTIQSQFEKAKKSIENISFKNSESCTFEDFRDGQFKNTNTNKDKNINKENEEKIYDEKIKKCIKSI